MNITRVIAAAVVVGVVVVPSAASAQMAPAGASFEQAPTSIGMPFVSLDRQDSVARIGVDLGWVKIDGADFPDAVYRIELHSQFIFSGSATNYLGGYGAVPFAWVSVGDQDDEFSVGGAEVGGFYGMNVGTGDVILRGGVTLPTADDDLDAFANIIASVARITDIVQAAPKTSVLRASGSYLGQSDSVFFRFDAGIDVPLFDISDDGDVDNDPFIRLNGGVGFGTPTSAGVVELANVIATSELDNSFGSAAVHVLGLAYRGLSGTLDFHGGIYIPLDDDFSSLVDLVISVGIGGRL